MNHARKQSNDKPVIKKNNLIQSLCSITLAGYELESDCSQDVEMACR